MDTILFFIGAVFAIAVIAKVTSSVLRQPAPPSVQSEVSKPQYRYARKQFIMSKAENDFYEVLQQVLGSAYIIVPQAHLTLFLDHASIKQDWRAARQVINRKSVDFLICNRTYYNPLVAIELDDKSHTRDDRKKRDELVESICREADMPLVRFPWNHEYDHDLILRRLAPYLK